MGRFRTWVNGPAGPFVVAALCVALGYVLHRPAPARVVEREHVTEHATSTATARVESTSTRLEVAHATTATVRHVERRRVETTPAGGTVVETVTEDERTDAGGTSTARTVATSAATVATSATVTRDERRETVTTAAPTWRASLGVAWPVPTRLRDVRAAPSEGDVALARRLAGPVWAEGWARASLPDLSAGRLRGAVGVKLSVEW